ncbi:glycosyltransferase family 39 protein [Polyangium jinanense]|uniref:Glycosyltransferase family 39 protein n=1 Tax=Polyangium jinanense TaxID=2829994 RepID=A0A9X3WZC8_9BACT|nr:glycosyltransferase family 39 protein [Polyangium jinanense]MDC3979740.1 glycosyltransferase family 39 protein [Polyangium jinanense]
MSPLGARGAVDKPSDEGRDRLFSAALFVLALLLRLYVAIAWAREPVWDGHYYDFGARRIAEGFGYSDDVVVGGQRVWHPWCHYPVGYSGFLAIFYRLFGAGPMTAPVVNAVTGALVVVLVHRLARYATTKNRARAAGLLCALDPGLIVYAALVMTEPLAALGLVAAGWLVARDAKTKPMRGALLAGLTLGLATLVRPQSLLCAPALGLFTLGDGTLRTKLKKGLVTAGIALATAVLVVLPWTARNCRVMDGCAFVSTNAGWNLAIGASPRATGRFETLRASDGCKVVTGQVQQDQCWRDEGLRWITNDPIRWLSLVPKKLSHTFDHESFPMGYLGEANPAAWPEPRKATGRAVLTTVHVALLALAALGLVASPLGRLPLRARLTQIAALLAVLGVVLHGILSDAHPFWPLAVLIVLFGALPLPGAPARNAAVGYLVFAVATVALTHAIFFGEDRYHVVITPVLCLLAALALRPSGALAAPSRAAADVPPPS